MAKKQKWYEYLDWSDIGWGTILICVGISFVVSDCKQVHYDCTAVPDENRAQMESYLAECDSCCGLCEDRARALYCKPFH